QMQWNMSDNVFENNIVYAGPRCLMSLIKTQVDKGQPPALIDDNLYYCAAGVEASTWSEVAGTIKGFDNYVRSTGNDQHSHFADPQFVDANANNFHLQLNSPALGAGTIDDLPVGELDLDGLPRVSSEKIDLGCYQKQ